MSGRVLVSALFACNLFAQDLTGIWQGTVKNPDNGQELRTVIKVASSDSNPINGNFYSIDQTFLVFPVTMTVQGTTVKINIPGIAATYEGKLNADGNAMTGTVKGFYVPTAWNMKRVPESEAWEIPKQPLPPRPMAPDAKPSFDVATIKPTKPEQRGGGMRVQDSNVVITGMTLVQLMRNVYDIHPNQLIGLPSWANSDRFDISGKPDVEGQPSQDQIKIMVKKLLADRFQLKFHPDKRKLPVFSLTVARGGAKISKNGPKDQNGTSGVIARAPGSFLFNNLNIDEFAKALPSMAVDRPVVNQTKLPGTYTFSLVWTPEQALTPVPNTSALASLDKAETPPDLRTAMQQQLGLRIDASKLPVEVMVIDKVEKPSDN